MPLPADDKIIQLANDLLAALQLAEPAVLRGGRHPSSKILAAAPKLFHSPPLRERWRNPDRNAGWYGARLLRADHVGAAGLSLFWIFSAIQLYWASPSAGLNSVTLDGMFVWIILLLATPASSQQKGHTSFGCASCHSESDIHTGRSAVNRMSAVMKMCGRCHRKEAETFTASQHRMANEEGPNCVTCHGAHAPKTASQIEQQCLECHRAPPLFFMKPVQRVPGKVACMNCHSAHND